MSADRTTIALDATYSVGQFLSGVGVYSREVLFGLARLHPDSAFRFYYRPHRFLRSLLDSVPRNAARRLLLRSTIPSARVFHGLNQRLPGHMRCRAVCTFHDLFVLTGEYSTPEFRERFAAQARDAASRADLIVCVSDYTASQVRDLLRIDSARIRVVKHGVHSPPRLPDIPRERLILHVGALQTRKNIVRLVEAFERVLPDYRLVLAGSDGFGAAEIRQRIESSPRRGDIEVLGYVDERQLRKLYSRAAMLAFPSLDEGFGIPVLEAMAWGTPVLTSNCSALPEAAGGAAVLVDPRNIEDLSAGLERLARDIDLRSVLIARGRQRVEGLTWENVVKEIWKIYGELL